MALSSIAVLQAVSFYLLNSDLLQFSTLKFHFCVVTLGKPSFRCVSDRYLSSVSFLICCFKSMLLILKST